MNITRLQPRVLGTAVKLGANTYLKPPVDSITFGHRDEIDATTLTNQTSLKLVYGKYANVNNKTLEAIVTNNPDLKELTIHNFDITSIDALKNLKQLKN